MVARVFDTTLVALIVAGYGVIVVAGAAQVFFRFFLQSSLSWSEELIRYVFVWSVFLTAAVAFERGQHIEIDFLTSRYPARLRRWMARLSWLCAILFVAFLFALGVQLVLSPGVRLQKSPAMEISMTIPYSAIWVGSALMMVNLLRVARRAWKGRDGRGPSVEVV